MKGRHGQAASGPYDGMSDEALLHLAQRHLIREASLPPGSIERSIAGAAYDAAAAELNRRFVRHAAARIREHRK